MNWEEWSREGGPKLCESSLTSPPQSLSPSECSLYRILLQTKKSATVLVGSQKGHTPPTCFVGRPYKRSASYVGKPHLVSNLLPKLKLLWWNILLYLRGGGGGGGEGMGEERRWGRRGGGEERG